MAENQSSSWTMSLTDYNGNLVGEQQEVTFAFDPMRGALTNVKPVCFNPKGLRGSFSFSLTNPDRRAIAMAMGDEDALIRLDLEADPDFDMEEYLNLVAMYPENR